MSAALALQGHQRRQAPPCHRVATGQDSGAASIDLSPFPPHPPTIVVPQKLGKAWQSGGVPIAKTLSGTRGEHSESVDQRRCNHVSPYSAKGAARFARTEFPRFAPFIPHFGPNLTHAGFCRFASAYLSISLFLEREEGKGRERRQKEPSTDRPGRPNMYPRIFSCVHGFSWIVDRAAAQCWCGFTSFAKLIHTSTTGNALGGAAWPVARGQRG